MSPELRTIEEVPAQGLCIGCGTCAGVCPARAMEMHLDDDDDMPYPVVQRSICTECGLCRVVCPGLGIDFEKLNRFVFGRQPQDLLVGVVRKIWVGYSTDEELRFSASSGGAVTELCAFALTEGLIDGAIVATASKQAPLRPVFKIATSRRELIQASGSKYCPISQHTVLRELAERDGHFAAVGLPCHIHGWRKAALRSDRLHDQLTYGFGLACGRVCNFFATEYYLRGKGISVKDVQELDYRGQGWPGKITVTLENRSQQVFLRRYSMRQLYQALQHNAAFGFQHFRPWRCLTCCDRTAELADISFSDPYLPRFLEGDTIGHTMIAARTKRGEALVEAARAAGRLILEPVSLQDFVESHGRELEARKAVPAMFLAASLAGKALPEYHWTKDAIRSPSLTDWLSCMASVAERWVGQKRWAWPLIMPWAFLRTILRYSGKAFRKAVT